MARAACRREITGRWQAARHEPRMEPRCHPVQLPGFSSRPGPLALYSWCLRHRGFTYQICDLLGLCDTATVNITVGQQGVGGSVTGMTPDKVTCKTPDEKLVKIFDGAKTFDCEAAGLVVSPGDRVRIIVEGVAD